MPHACWLAHANSVRTSRGVAPSARRAAVDSSPLTSLRTLNAWMAKSSDVLPSTIHSWAANGLCSGAQRTALGRGAAAQRTTTCDHAAARARKESDDQVPTGAEPEGSRCPARASRLRDGECCGAQRRRAALLNRAGVIRGRQANSDSRARSCFFSPARQPARRPRAGPARQTPAVPPARRRPCRSQHHPEGS